MEFVTSEKLGGSSNINTVSGFAFDGVMIFNALSGVSTDAVESESASLD